MSGGKNSGGKKSGGKKPVGKTYREKTRKTIGIIKFYPKIR